MNNLEILKAFMDRYGLTHRQVSEVTGYSIDSVYSWTCQRRPVEDKVIKSLTNLYGELE